MYTLSCKFSCTVQTSSAFVKFTKWTVHPNFGFYSERHTAIAPLRTMSADDDTEAQVNTAAEVSFIMRFGSTLRNKIAYGFRTCRTLNQSTLSHDPPFGGVS